MNLREIDRLVAEKVMGWKIFVSRNVDTGTVSEFYDDGEDLIKVSEWCPTLNISQAWQVVEEVGYEQVQIKDMGKFGKRVYIEKTDSNVVIAYAETVPVALCLAALKAYGIEVEGEE